MKKKDVSQRDAQRLQDVILGVCKIRDNYICADCSATARWASVNIGVFLCSTCAGYHRGLGVHITQVRSLTLDTWTPAQVLTIMVNGNKWVNSYTQPHDPSGRPMKPSLQQVIRHKYVDGRNSNIEELEKFSSSSFTRLDVNRVLGLYTWALEKWISKTDHGYVRQVLLRAAGYSGNPQNRPPRWPIDKPFLLDMRPADFFNNALTTAKKSYGAFVDDNLDSLTDNSVGARSQESLTDNSFSEFSSAPPTQQRQAWPAAGEEWPTIGQVTSSEWPTTPVNGGPNIYSEMDLFKPTAAVSSGVFDAFGSPNPLFSAPAPATAQATLVDLFDITSRTSQSSNSFTEFTPLPTATTTNQNQKSDFPEDLFSTGFNNALTLGHIETQKPSPIFGPTPVLAPAPPPTTTNNIPDDLFGQLQQANDFCSCAETAQNQNTHSQNGNLFPTGPTTLTPGITTSTTSAPARGSNDVDFILSLYRK